MIFCEEPWYNEPGREGRVNSYMARQYNNEVRVWTMRYAILPWAVNIKADDGAISENAPNGIVTALFWHQTVRLYLRIKAVDIVRATETALWGLMGGTDRAGLNLALTNIRDALKHQGYWL